jgi:predicted transcriptional regulator YdeE
MKDTTVAPFCMIGMATRTTNEQQQAAKDIPLLWEAFLSGNAAAKIPGIQSPDIYCVYTEYESDYTRPYTVVLGYKVDSLEHIPEGFKGVVIAGGAFKKITATGKLADGIVYNAWTRIWDAGWNRAYTTDFEVYGAKAQDPETAEMDIFVAVK